MPRAEALALVAMLTGLAGGLTVPSATAAEADSTTEAPVVVTIPQRALLSSPAVPITSAVGMTAPYSLARETQSELHRLGCYQGEISGIWTPGTRSAAQRFVDRVNAKLPVDKPDGVLLALLRGQTGTVCGQCQSDQTLDAAGRCVPTALINKVQRPRSTTTEPIADAPRPERPPSDPALSVPERETVVTSRRSSSQPYAGTTKSWQGFIRKVDRALGLD